MKRVKWLIAALVFVVFCVLLGILSFTGHASPILASPTFVAVFPPTSSSPATSTPEPLPLVSATVETLSHPVLVTTFTPTSISPLPAVIPTRTTVPTPTPTPMSTSTPFSMAAPVLIGVTSTPSDTMPIPTSVPVAEMAPDTINVLVLGSDRRPGWDDWHTDVIQIVSIQPSVPAVTVLSIPRDLYVYIPGFWMSRINFADMYGEVHGYNGGGPALVQQTFLYNLGIPIDHYVRTDFDGLIGIVDGLGGIDIPVHCRLEDHWPYPDENGEYPIKALEPGVHHMDGETALWYARSRMTSSVFARERRQQQVLEAIWRQSRSIDLLPRIPQLWDQLRTMVVTDLNLGDTLVLAEMAFRLEGQNVRFRNIGYQQVIPWTTPKGGAVFLPNWEEIDPIVSEALGPVPEGRMWRTLQPVEVWNGTSGSDWDQLAADRLLRQGFFATIGLPDRQDYPQTQLIDFTSASKGNVTAFLQQMFNVLPENVVQASGTDAHVQYRLIIGSDYRPCSGP